MRCTSGAPTRPTSLSTTPWPATRTPIRIVNRRAVMEVGMTVTPGSNGNLGGIDEALREANRIGCPIMLKATSGGGPGQRRKAT